MWNFYTQFVLNKTMNLVLQEAVRNKKFNTIINIVIVEKESRYSSAYIIFTKKFGEWVVDTSAIFCN